MRYPPKVLQVTATYSESDQGLFDLYECNGTFTFTLLSPNKRRRVYISNTGVGTITVATAGTGATIDGAASISLATLNGATLVANGLEGSSGQWHVCGIQTGASSTSTITTGAIAGGDASLAIDGLASGTGGAIVIAGGTSSTAATAGGAVTLKGGTGSTSGAGGATNVLGGVGGATGIGGAVNITGGVPTDAAGGAVVIAGGAGVGTNRAGGLASVTGGASTGSATGGVASLVGGAASAATGVGGAALVTGGAGNTTGAGGAVTLAGGAGGSDAVGGAVSLTGGAAGGGNRAGGAASLVGGAGAGSAAGGAITITSGAAGATGVAGAVNISVGAATAGAGSSLTLTGGNGAGGTAAGGNVNAIPGAAVSTGVPGEFQVNSVAGMETAQWFQNIAAQLPVSGQSNTIFIAERAYRVKSASVICSSTATVPTVDIKKETGTTAPGSGTTILTGAISFSGTANTRVTGTLVATVATITLAAGDRLSVTWGGTVGTLIGGIVSVSLVPC